MNISVALLPALLPGSAKPQDDSNRDGGDHVVVIDVLRATSVMTTAMAVGAKRIITCREVESARSLAPTLDEAPLLCGERGCRPIDGFDLGNSPAEYRRDVLADRTLIMTTTNGTAAIDAAGSAPNLWAASFLNLSAVVTTLSEARNVQLICAGTDGEVTAEDVLLAGALAVRWQEFHGAELDGDQAILACELWQSWLGGDSASEQSLQNRLTSRLAETAGGKNLVRLGFGADLARCAAIDTFDLVPRRVAKTPSTFEIAPHANPDC